MAEEQPTRRSCGAQLEHRRLLNEDPAYADARSEIETLARAYQTGARSTERAGLTVIPVVVHVVWNTNAQNISDAQVQSQIDVLNADFRAANADVGQTPGVWQSVVADARVVFALATTDPNGAPSSGITRTQTQTVAFPRVGNPVKSAATGGVDPWPSDRYLNIWVCPLGNNLLGYAQFPGGPANTEGVVVLHSAFGTNGTAAAPFNRGRTTTHEVGHWLNLFHIWGDDGTGCGGSDEVGDTPNAAGPNYGCPTFPHVSCSNGPNGDMFMNYMDYTDDACMYMFTIGQTARIQATLDGARASIGSQLTGWSGWGTLGGILTSDIAAANNADGRMEVFVRGADNALWHKWQTAPSNGWSDWGTQGGGLTSNITVAANADRRLEFFVRGTDNALWHKWQTAPSNGWSDWATQGGGLSSDVAMGKNADGRLEMFVRGTDNGVWHKWQVAPNSVWSDWATQGGVITSNITVASNADGRMEMFARGTDNGLWHKWQVAPNSVWSDWATQGGILTSNISVGKNADGRMEMFVRGADNALWHNWQVAPNSVWSGWATRGGILTSDPIVAQNADGRLEVFARGADNALWHIWQTAPNNGWSGWSFLGGVLTSNITAARNADGRLEVFARGTDNALWHIWQF